MRNQAIEPRSIVITGANNGIGVALTSALLQEGDRVVELHIG